MDTCVAPRVSPAGAARPAVAFVQHGAVCHISPFPRPLRQRICRAAHLQGVRDGFLPDAEECRAWLATAAPRAGSAPSACAARALYVVVQGTTTTYVREVRLAALLPWAQLAAAALAQQGYVAADTPSEICLVALPPEDAGDGEAEALPPFAIRDVPDGRASGDGVALHPAQDDLVDLPIVVPDGVLSASVAFCQADTAIERGGVFVGHLARDGAAALFVDVRHFIPAEQTVATATTLRFTPQTWAGIQSRRRALGPDLHVVGWIHSHLRSALSEDAECSGLFLSGADVACMAAFFDGPAHFAVVAAGDGPAGLATACASFGWDEHGVGLRQRSLRVVEGRERP